MLGDQIIFLALQEDIGHGDITTDSIVAPNQKACAEIRAKEGLVLSGLEVAAKVFHALDASIAIEAKSCDGDTVSSGTTVAQITGPAQKILTGERTALNFLQRLSGIATHTAKYVELVKGTKVKIVDTRKTAPGQRGLEKYAVRCGGGFNHRFGLDDGILIKDNHIKVAGGISEAVKKIRESASHLLKIEVEVETFDQIHECLSLGVDCILLDNMSVEELGKAVKVINKQCLTEASGGISKETIRQIAETGIDLISVGALTHSFRSVDLNMEITF